jgi:hypothetical protein
MTTLSTDASRVDIELMSGDDETFRITKQDQNGNAEDISGWIFWLTIKEDRDDSDSEAVIQKPVTSHTDPANGTTEVTLTADDTADLSGAYYYDMQFKTDTGTIQTFVIGGLYIKPDITEAS